jgi:hypothetical protein
MTKFELVYTDTVGIAIHRLFRSHGDLCSFLDRFEVTSGCRATVKQRKMKP